MTLTSFALPAASPLSGKAHYLDWGVIQISLTNVIIIVVMVLLFAAAVLVPFPHSRPQQARQENIDDPR